MNLPHLDFVSCPRHFHLFLNERRLASGGPEATNFCRPPPSRRVRFASDWLCWKLGLLGFPLSFSYQRVCDDSICLFSVKLLSRAYQFDPIIHISCLGAVPARRCAELWRSIMLTSETRVHHVAIPIGRLWTIIHQTPYL